MWDIVAQIHRLLDAILNFLNLLQKREIGWLTVDRKSGTYKCEQQPLWKKVKLLLLFNPVTEWIDRTRLLRLWTHEGNISAVVICWTGLVGRRESQLKSHRQIKGFVDFYAIDMCQLQPSNPENYSTFEDLFVPKHAPNARPIYAPNDPSKAVIVADCRVVVYSTVDKTKALWVKGSEFTIANLIKDKQLAVTWKGGAVVSFRLSPQDYHRYHSPVEGTVKWYKHIPGDYYQVDPVALHSSVNILAENASSYVCIESECFNDVLFVAIGATDIGTVKIHYEIQMSGHHISKGDEIGLFQFGGPSILLLFQTGRIEFDNDLESLSREDIMTDVEVGMSLGKACKASGPAPRKEEGFSLIGSKWTWKLAMVVSGILIRYWLIYHDNLFSITV